MDKKLLLIIQDGLCGYINTSGEIVIEPKFYDSRDFSEGLARVCVNDDYAYINPNGDVRFLIGFDFAWDFKDGLACIGVTTDSVTK